MNINEFEYFMDSPTLRYLLMESLEKHECVHEYFYLKNQNGEFAGSYEELRQKENAQKFTHMTTSTFDYIFKAIKKDTEYSNFRQHFSPEKKKLIVTLK